MDNTGKEVAYTVYQLLGELKEPPNTPKQLARIKQISDYCRAVLSNKPNEPLDEET